MYDLFSWTNEKHFFRVEDVCSIGGEEMVQPCGWVSWSGTYTVHGLLPILRTNDAALSSKMLHCGRLIP